MEYNDRLEDLKLECVDAMQRTESLDEHDYWMGKLLNLHKWEK